MTAVVDARIALHGQVDDLPNISLRAQIIKANELLEKCLKEDSPNYTQALNFLKYIAKLAGLDKIEPAGRGKKKPGDDGGPVNQSAKEAVMEKARVMLEQREQTDDLVKDMELPPGYDPDQGGFQIQLGSGIKDEGDEPDGEKST